MANSGERLPGREDHPKTKRLGFIGYLVSAKMKTPNAFIF
jgi:hypothetical protein